MNIGSKNKKRVVLPSRPEPPTVDQILEDISRAAPSDPVFSILEKTGQDWAQPADSDVDSRFQQCRQFLQLNERLQEVRGRLLRQREELRAAGEQLGRDVEEVRGQTLTVEEVRGQTLTVEEVRGQTLTVEEVRGQTLTVEEVRGQTLTDL